MTASTKIDFRHRSISQLADITDLAAILFPGNRNQQYAAAQILLFLKRANEPVPSLMVLESQCSISRRTLQRTRAKLARLGLIEHITWMSARSGDQQGWRLSSRMPGALRLLADKLEAWRKDLSGSRLLKDDQLAALLK